MSIVLHQSCGGTLRAVRLTAIPQTGVLSTRWRATEPQRKTSSTAGTSSGRATHHERQFWNPGKVMLKDRENILNALREKPLKAYQLMRRANLPNEEACQSLLLKMRDEGLVKFDIHKGLWHIQ
jgi:hypothetical protein